VGIAAGFDGNVWNTQRTTSSVGAMTTAGVIVHNTPITTTNALVGFMSSGPDNALWFAEFGAGIIARLTTFGVLMEYATPTANSGTERPITGPDGNLWFVEFNGNNVGRITPTGTITEWAIPTANATPFDIAVGSDGNLWFTELEGKVARFVLPSP
jgi:virginiamycin B lyase